MTIYRPKDRTVNVVQWFPPQDPQGIPDLRHDLAWPVTREDTDPLDDGVETGEIGWCSKGTLTGPRCPTCGVLEPRVERQYWLRTSTSSAIYLEPGRFIVKDLGRLETFDAIELFNRYEPIEPDLPGLDLPKTVLRDQEVLATVRSTSPVISP